MLFRSILLSVYCVWCGALIAHADTSGSLTKATETAPLPASNEVSSKDESRWELGVGIGYIDLPHYRGSDQRDSYVAPVPYVVYNGKRLNVDREGGRYYVVKGKDWALDLSAAFNFPVDSEDNQARSGMPDLAPILEAGPRLQWYLYQSEDERFRVRAGLPLRLALNLSKVEDEGWVFAPYLQVRYYSFMETAVSVGPMWASERYHDYYYQVDSEFATAIRPSYDAKAGYSGYRATLTSNHRVNEHWWWGVFARYDSLAGAVIEDSPLVRKNDNWMAGFVLAYIFNPVKAYYENQRGD